MFEKLPLSKFNWCTDDTLVGMLYFDMNKYGGWIFIDSHEIGSDMLFLFFHSPVYPNVEEL